MKNILLFMTDFYNYNYDIINEMEKQKCAVKWYQDKINFSFLDTILSKMCKNYKINKFNKYFDGIIKNEKGNKYDEIVIIFGAGFMNETHLKVLKKTFPQTPIVYYAWDSVANFPSIKSLFAGADRSYSFDKNDCFKYGVEFLPLFYLSKSDSDSKKNKWDVSTIMSFYNKKSNSLRRLFDVLPNGLNEYFFLRIRSKEYYMFMKIFHRKNFKKFKNYFTLSSLNRDECLNIIKNSVAVIDCPVPNQNGLTMRTFEALAMNTKLITSNINVAEYEFFTPNNIFIVDSNTSEIPLSFFSTPFDMQFQISEKYSLKHFVEVLIQ
ncbi:hypothetical protein [Blautia obeum]|uniref:Lipopolysaccharide biosynthesis protein n=1 Tax=Blautia obeum TaxID=40520 RepID=A0A414SDI3_9FIRM|nr:hypothetical protein [Blautia obeum]RHG17337.1 hypothetical protein DW272_09855 [Blautia obeum]SCH29127.1 Uncharacterized protein conserved in bacteria [uncultured Ruminococcus sp.]